MRLPLFLGDAHRHDFAARLADMGTDRHARFLDRLRDIGEAKLLVLLPEPVGGEFRESAEPFLALFQPCLRCLAFVRRAERLHSDKEADAAEAEGERQAKTDALHQIGAQERASGNIDRKGAHDVVDMPLRLVRLQPVVAVDTAFLGRCGRVDGTEDQVVSDGEKARPRRWIGLALEQLDGCRHGRVGRRRRDRPSRSADPLQAQDVVGVAHAVEQLDGMGAERRWDRHLVAAEVAANFGVVGHERVDELQRGGFLLALAGDVPAQIQ